MTAVLIALCMYTLSLNDSRAHSRAHPSSHNTARTVLRLSVGSTVGLDLRAMHPEHAQVLLLPPVTTQKGLAARPGSQLTQGRLRHTLLPGPDGLSPEQQIRCGPKR